MSFTLVACGGGGGGSDSPSNGSLPTPATPEASAPNPVQIEQRSMSELSVPDGFSYQNSSEQSIEINISQFVGENAFVSIYSQYNQLASGEYQAIASSKVVSSPLLDGMLSTSFSLDGSTTSFLVEIWHVGAEQPLQKEFSNTDVAMWIE